MALFFVPQKNHIVTCQHPLAEKMFCNFITIEQKVNLSQKLDGLLLFNASILIIGELVYLIT